MTFTGHRHMTPPGGLPVLNDRPVRAALLTPGLALGGAERWLVSLVRETNRERLVWTGVAVSSAGGTDEMLCRELAGLTTLHCQQPDTHSRNPGRPFHLDYFRHVHADWSAAVAAACADAEVVVAWGAVHHVGQWTGRLPIPSVVVSHTTEREPELNAIHGVTHLAAVSEAAAAYFDHRPGREVFDDVKVVYNGADIAHCQPRKGRQWQRNEWGVANDEFVVGYIGRESPEKNFLAAAKGVLQLGAPYRAVCYGSLVQNPGEHDPALIRLAEQAQGRIILHLPVPYVGDVLAGLDVLMLASHREAFSLALIEAWLAGVPVVATPVGSVPELQSRFRRRLVIEVPRDPTPEQLAKAIRRACGKEGRKIAAAAQKLARQHFTCAAMSAHWTDYLTPIVDEYRRKRLIDYSGTSSSHWMASQTSVPAGDRTP